MVRFHPGAQSQEFTKNHLLGDFLFFWGGWRQVLCYGGNSCGKLGSYWIRLLMPLDSGLMRTTAHSTATTGSTPSALEYFSTLMVTWGSTTSPSGPTGQNPSLLTSPSIRTQSFIVLPSPSTDFRMIWYSCLAMEHLLPPRNCCVKY